MASFLYRAKDRKGELIQGSMEADSEPLVVQRLQSMGYFPFEVRDTTVKKKHAVLERLTQKRITLDDKTAFTRQLSDLLSAGVPLVRGLSVIESQTANDTFCEIIKQIRANVEKGDSLADAFAQHPKQFPTLFSSMVRAGEAGGLLSEVLQRLADFSEAESELRGKVKSALAYPVLMVFASIAAIAILMTVVIPKITKMYDQTNQSLPWMTEVLIAVSGFCSHFWWVLLAGVVGGVLLFGQYYRTWNGRYRIDWLTLRMPVMGAVIGKREVARFARTFGSLLHNGVSVLPALRIVADVLDNHVVRREVAAMPDVVAQGSGVANSLKDSKVFPPVVINMMAIGEETGRLDVTLIKVADSYEKEVDRSVRAMMSLLEPMIILFMGVVVGFIVIAMLMPIFMLDIGG